MENTFVNIGGHKVTTNKVGSVHTVTTLATGFTGTIYWSVTNGICTLTVWNVVASSATAGQTALTDVPKAKHNCVITSNIASSLWIINANSTTLTANPYTANVPHFTTLTYPVADDWVES